jgi:Icc-related predicted phosphoesterase
LDSAAARPARQAAADEERDVGVAQRLGGLLERHLDCREVLCPFRVALLHYAPILETLHGERSEIWALLGTDRLAAPLSEHAPDLVLHGHAHAGTFAGALGSIPVYNVSVPVMGEDFWVFEMAGAKRTPSEVH